MSNSLEHMSIGAISTGIGYLIKEKSLNKIPNKENLLGSLILGGFMGLLPDILEPANNPQHRQFFHSIIMGLITMGIKNENYQKLLDLSKYGYLSHLALDALTPASLPLI